MVSFAVLFPGFFIYHTAIGTGSIPDFAGGYFSPACVVLLPLLSFLYVRAIYPDRNEYRLCDVFFFGFLVYFSVVVAFNFAGGANKDVVVRHSSAILQFATCYMVFRTLDASSGGDRRLLIFSMIVMSALVFILSTGGTFYLKKDDDFHGDSTATYEGFARSFLVTALFVLPFTKKRFFRYFLYVLSLAVLYLNGARSEFVSFAVFSVVTETLLSRSRILALLAITVLVAVVLSVILSGSPVMPENRIFELTHFSDSSSWGLREKFKDAAVNTIAENPIAGDYASYAIVSPGAYAHNLLSAWVDLGIIGFFCVLMILVVPIVDMIRMAATIKGVSRRPDYIFVLGLLLITLIMAMGSKTFTTMFVAIAFGAYASYKAAIKRQGNFAKRYYLFRNRGHAHATSSKLSVARRSN